MGLNEFLREIPKGIHIVDAGIYAANTLGIEQRPPAALQVADRAAISSLVRIASAHSVRLNAVSTGKNWGYGSALSADREAIIVDLSLLKSVNFNVSDETVTLEPGVTQGQLFAYLRDSNLPFMAPTTGAGPNVSIMGNALERGYGVTPIEDHWSAVVRLEAVLADGSIYRPAMQELTGSCHWHWDIGPYMQGLFAQSALGIVTEITLRLYPRPETTGFFYAKSADLGQLIRFAKSMRKLEFVKGVNIMNGLRVAGIAQDSRPKPYWTLVGTFYTPTIFVRVLKAFIRTAASREKLRVTTIDQTLFRRFRWLLRRMSKQMHKLVGEFFKAVDGEPTTINLNLVRGEHNVDKVGLIWFSPIVAAQPSTVMEMNLLIEEVCRKHSIKPLLTCTLISRTLVDMTLPILFDKETEGAQAWACYDELMEKSRKIGCMPYRLPINKSSLLTSTAANRVHAAIKGALDPRGVFSVGRYLGRN